MTRQLVPIVLLLLLFLSAMAEPTPASMVGGRVVFFESGLVVVRTQLGFSVGRWMGGGLPFQGDEIIGELHGIGMKTCYLPRQDREIKLFLERFGCTEGQAIEWVQDHR